MAESSFLQDIQAMDFISAHEHISSLASFGAADDLFFPADEIPQLEPCRSTYLNDLLLSPYYAGPLFAAGYQPSDGPLGQKKSFLQWFERIRPSLALTQNIGTYRTLSVAFRSLYGCTLEDAASAWRLNQQIESNYSNYPAWYQSVMQRANTKRIIKPVHPQYFRNAADGFETPYAKPIARIDSLFGLIRDGGLDFTCLQRSMGLFPQKLDDCVEAVDHFYSLIQDRAVGIKQLQAYRRPLYTTTPAYSEARQAFPEAIAHGGEAARVVQDYLHRCILEKAEQLSLPYQIHTGMTNLKNSSPADLEPLVQQYPHIRFVLLHCYPYLSEAVYLARTYSNCFIDTSWLAIQGDRILENALTQYLSMLPLNKITLSVDATSLEEYYGGVDISRKLLARVLGKAVQKKELTVAGAELAAESLLHTNADSLYSL